ncbi:MAG: type II toxin-antitoxin system RelE/ParE family toxin [Candidatus Diapherotrites archaeon]|nr:type II toxin-antitoxin system RelE/ParE family toxin [Candidatus Diapherotrites archaeon]
MYKLIFTSKAKKQLTALDKELQKRMLAALVRVRIRPEKHIKKLVETSYYSLRVGEYRVIIDLKRKKLIILVINIGHRKKVYNKI